MSEEVKPVPGQAALDEAKKQREAAIAQAQEANAKIQARAEELKTFVGKSFKRKDGMNPHQIITVIGYGGIGTLASGQLAHLFKVEARNPGAAWSLPATVFLGEHEEIAIESKPTVQEVI